MKIFLGEEKEITISTALERYLASALILLLREHGETAIKDSVELTVPRPKSFLGPETADKCKLVFGQDHKGDFLCRVYFEV